MGFQDYNRLKVLTIGAGAIGTYIGGSLSLSGNPVVFLEQPGAAEEILRKGMLLNLKNREHVIDSPEITSNAEAAIKNHEFDIAICALKSFDTLSMIKSLLPYRENVPPIFCVQNGVENEALIAEYLGQEKVIAGTLTSAVGRRGIGNIILERKRGMGVAAGHKLSGQLVDELNAAGLNARLYPEAASMKWSKMLTNLLANATSAILDLSPADVFSNPDLCRLEVDQLLETNHVMRAQGLHVIDLPGTPVKALVFAVRWFPMAGIRPILIRAVGSGRGGKMPSFHIDLRSGRGQTEVDSINGAVVRSGERYKIATPANRLLNEILLDMATGKISLDVYTHKPEELLKRYKLNINKPLGSG